MKLIAKTGQGKDKHITVGYLYDENQELISIITVNNSILKYLSNFVKVSMIPIDFKRLKLQHLKEQINKADFLIFDLKNVRILPFLMRERGDVNLPFIILLHTVVSWIEPIVYSIPLLREEDILIVPSQHARKCFLKITGRFKVHIIPNCLDAIALRRKAAAWKERRLKNKVISYLGRLEPEKGIEALVDCMPDIVAWTGQAHLRLIGPLSGSYIRDYPQSPFVTNLKKKIERLGLSKRVKFIGLRLGDKKYRLLSRSDLFVYPTTAKGETFAMANLEAMACGVPVITTNWAGNKELIKNGRNGYLIDTICNKKGDYALDTRQLVSLIVKVLQDDKLRRKLSREAQKSSLSYDWRKVFPRLIRLLRVRKKMKLNSRWDSIKDKTVMDFRHLYTREMLFFIPLLNKISYGFVWNAIMNTHKANGETEEYRKRYGHNIEGNFCVGSRYRIKFRKAFRNMFTDLARN